MHGLLSAGAELEHSVTARSLVSPDLGPAEERREARHDQRNQDGLRRQLSRLSVRPGAADKNSNVKTLKWTERVLPGPQEEEPRYFILLPCSALKSNYHILPFVEMFSQ